MFRSTTAAPLPNAGWSRWAMPLCVLFGIDALAIASWISVPMIPVPMTLQTWAVLLIAALYGARYATLTVGGYLLVAALGLPVLADFKAGVHNFFGPTGGYLAASRTTESSPATTWVRSAPRLR